MAEEGDDAAQHSRGAEFAAGRPTVSLRYPLEGDEVVLLGPDGPNLRIFAVIVNPEQKPVKLTASLNGSPEYLSITHAYETVETVILLNNVPVGDLHIRIGASVEGSAQHVLESRFVGILPWVDVQEVVGVRVGEGNQGVEALDVRWNVSKPGLVCDEQERLGAVVYVNGEYAGTTKHQWIRVFQILRNSQWAPLCSLGTGEEGGTLLSVEVRLVGSVRDVAGSGGTHSILIDKFCDPCRPLDSYYNESALQPWGEYLAQRPDPCIATSHPVLLRPKRYAIFLGLAKAGTSSLYFGMQAAGISTVHTKNEWGELTDHIYAAVAEDKEMFAYLQIPDCIILSSMEIYPQIDFLDIMTAQYPDSLFVLNKRDIKSHIRSIDKWLYDDKRQLMMRDALVAANIPGLPPGKGREDAELAEWLEWFYHRTRQHISQLPGSRFLEFTIEDDFAARVNDFLDTRTFEKLHLNAGTRVV
uniref:Uncharacterized protein n=2 Tax=Hemiselmis andersenii TaxID=464988 RepID=A0A7S1DZ08_HEMAN